MIGRSICLFLSMRTTEEYPKTARGDILHGDIPCSTVLERRMMTSPV